MFASSSKIVAKTSTGRRGLATQAIVNPRYNKERVLILGSGWGGYNVARTIDRKKYDVTVVSPTGYFTFTPLLASTSVGTLEFRTALESVRRLKDVKFSMARATAVDLKAQTVSFTAAVPNPIDSAVSASLPPRALLAPPPNFSSTIEQPGGKENFTMGYDKLIVAVGAFSATFGTKGVYEHAHFLKDVRDARAIRKRIMDCFERAAQPFVKESVKRDLLSFRIVGGGPTGVEFAAELCDLITSDMRKLYPDLASLATINLYDVAPGILLSFDESLREFAMRSFAREGVTIHPNSKVLEVGDGWMEIAGQGKIPFGLLVWSTGLQPNPLIQSLGAIEKDPRSKSLLTDDTLHVLDAETSQPMPNVYAIGDNAVVKNGERLPATAQVATQKAIALAKNLNALAINRSEKPFQMQNAGSMVYLGHWKAMIDRTADNVLGIKGKNAGLGAWFLWRSAYWAKAMSWRNRVMLLTYWIINGVTGRDMSRF